MNRRFYLNDPCCDADKFLGGNLAEYIYFYKLSRDEKIVIMIYICHYIHNDFFVRLFFRYYLMLLCNSIAT